MATGLHTLESWLQPAATQLVDIAAAAGLSPRVSSARRSHGQQALLYRRFLAGQSRFPAAPPGHSSHELGLAFDLWVNDESQLADLGTVWEQMGGVWGGHFRDPIHFEAGGVDLAAIAPEVLAAPVYGAVENVADIALSFIPGITAPEIVGMVLPKSSSQTPAALVYNEVVEGLEHPVRAVEDIGLLGEWLFRHIF